MSRISLW